jgi:NitT/TauT family transport system permease protein
MSLDLTAEQAPAAGRTPEEIRAADEHEVRLRREVDKQALSERRRRRIQVNVGRIALFVGILTLWQIGSWNRLVDRLFFSDPISIFNELTRRIGNGELPYHLAFTAQEVIYGYVWGAVFGLLAAMLLSQFPKILEIIQPFLLMLYSIPRVALAPLIIMWFGIGITSKIVLAATLVFFIVFVNTMTGIQNVNPQLISIGRIMGASRWQLMSKIVIRAAMPYVMTALRLSLPTAMIGAIIGEFISANRGIGWVISSASSAYNTAGVFAGILSLLVLVMALDMIIAFIEARLMRWQPTIRPGGEQG